MFWLVVFVVLPLAVYAGLMIWHCVASGAGVRIGLAGVGLLVGLGAALALLTSATGWLNASVILILNVYGAARVEQARLAVFDCRAAGSDPAVPRKVMRTTGALVAFATFVLAVPLDGPMGVWLAWFAFCVSGWSMLLIAIGYRPEPPSAAVRRANRRAVGEAVLWFLR